MHYQTVVVLLLGLIAATSALDLSHAKRETTEVDPRIFNFINDFYAQVIYQPLNHVVTNLALLGAQVLAGISQTGIPAPNGRTLQPTEAELRGFFDDLWNNAVRPPLENALSGAALMAAQLLAGLGVNGINLGVGKRDLTEAELRGFFDDLWNNAVRPPLENALSGAALMAAQLLAGLGVNGINLGVGKRDLTEAELRGFFDDLWNNAVRPPLENALSGAALMAAQLLAGLGVNGINLGVGKRDLTEAEMRNIFDDLWNNAIRPPLENALSGAALMAAQLLAGLGVNGISLGKRELAVDARGAVIDSLVEHATGLYVTQVKPVVENALNAAALHLAGILANFAQNGIGRR